MMQRYYLLSVPTLFNIDPYFTKYNLLIINKLKNTKNNSQNLCFTETLFQQALTNHNYAISDLFLLCNISRQGHHQRLIREKIWADMEYLIVGLIMQIREVHPGMGLRVMYDILNPTGLGRDAFISIGFAYGFRLVTYKSPIKTTFSSPYSRYKNLLVDKKLYDINQLTSDITYYNIAEKFYYIVMIMDVYSRKIIGYSVADNMRAENNCQALEMAFKTRKKRKFENLIHHSDRGGQYISDDYTLLLTNAEIKISMCNEVHENAHIERVNVQSKISTLDIGILPVLKI